MSSPRKTFFLTIAIVLKFRIKPVKGMTRMEGRQSYFSNKLDEKEGIKKVMAKFLL